MGRPDRLCGIAFCERKHKAQGYCDLHYRRLRKYGSPLGGPPPRERKPAPCGTYAGYQRHRRDREVPCEACAPMAAAYVRGWRQRKGEIKRVLIPVALLDQAMSECSPETAYQLAEYAQGARS